MKCLIIGGGGFVGSWLCKEMTDRGHDVVVIDPFVYYSNWTEKKKKIIREFKKKNLLYKSKVYDDKFENIGKKIMVKEKPDTVVHLAGAPLEKADDDEFSLRQLKDDVGLTFEVIRAVKDSPCVKKFVFMSSIAAYGDCNDTIKETATLLPRTPYGITKASGEFLVQSDLTNWNIVRTTNVYGFGDMNGRASNIITNRILEGKEVWVNSNIIMDFTYVKDLANGIATIVEKAEDEEIFHISGGKARKLTDLVKILKKKYDFEYEVKSIADRPKRGTMDNSKANEKLGWIPSYSLEKGVEDYLTLVEKYKVA